MIESDKIGTVRADYLYTDKAYGTHVETTLHDEIREWLKEENIKYYLPMVDVLGPGNMVIEFDNDEDEILFKLRWC